MRIALVLFCALVLAGCAATRQYEWGEYEDLLYGSYKDPSKMEAMKSGLEAHIDVLEKNRQKVAPGLYAELGTLHLQAGAQDKAVAMYARERDLWPESKGLMETMIRNLERRKAGAEGSPK